MSESKVDIKKPWVNWPKELPTAAERLEYPEYQALSDKVFVKEMASEIRERAINYIRKEIGEDKCDGIAVLLKGGTSDDFQLYCSDTDKTEFRQEAFFRYLFQLNEPDCYGVLDLSKKESVIYIPYISDDAQRWQGARRTLDWYNNTYGVNHTLYTHEIYKDLTNRNIKKILVLRGLNTDSGSMTKTTASIEEIIELAKENNNNNNNNPSQVNFEVNKELLHPLLSELRLIKTNKEIELMRRICTVSAMAHVYVMRHIKDGMMELQCEALFKAYSSYFGSSRHVGYTCICGSGPNGAVLHYGHAGYPNDKLIKNNELIVLDMGAEFHGYTSDLTRSYPINGVFTEDQLKIHNAVRHAQNAVYQVLKPGVSWPHMHRLAERVILLHLLRMGLVHGDDDNIDNTNKNNNNNNNNNSNNNNVNHLTIDSFEKNTEHPELNADEFPGETEKEKEILNKLMSNYIGAVFMPHGLGHLLGLNVHDVGGYKDLSDKSKELGLRWLRCGRILQEGMILTVEPGIYFNEPWIRTAFSNPDQARYLNKNKIEKLFNFGGVRLEDDILITKNGCENLSGNWPTTASDISDVILTAQNRK